MAYLQYVTPDAGLAPWSRAKDTSAFFRLFAAALYGEVCKSLGKRLVLSGGEIGNCVDVKLVENITHFFAVSGAAERIGQKRQMILPPSVVPN